MRNKSSHSNTQICKHCGDPCYNVSCEKGCLFQDECIDCHNEIRHGIIKNMNIHIIGGPGGPEGIDDISGIAPEDIGEFFSGNQGQE